MPVVDPPPNGAIVSTTSYQTFYENTSFGVHEGYLIFENIADGDEFEILIEVKNVYRANLTTVRDFKVDWAYLGNGTEPCLRIAARQTNHMKVSVKKTLGNNRTISFAFFLITAK